MTYLQRKKLAFMSIVNRIKGFIRTVSGALPLTLPDCVDGDSLINYTIEGNSVQDGTPTPETPVEVQSVGELTKNLFGKYVVATKGFETHILTDNGVILTPTSLKAYQSYISFKLENMVLGGTYTISVNLDFDETSGAKPYVRAGYIKTDGIYQNIKQKSVPSSGRWDINFTMPEEIPDDIHSNHGFVFFVNYTNVAATELVDLTISNIQLEEGSSATDYEPYGKYKIPVVCSDENGNSTTTNIYLDEPLRKVGNYQDYIDFEKRMVVRQVGVTEFNSSYAYAGYSNATYSFYGFYRSILTMKTGRRMSGLCIYLKNTPSNEYSQIWFGVNSKAIYVSLPDIFNMGNNSTERLQLFKDWLDALETPFLIYYPLETPTETPIVLPKLPTIKGTTIYSVDTKVQPSNMEVSYYSTSKE